MVEVGQIRTNDVGVRVSVVSRMEITGGFMVSDTPGEMGGPWRAETIETAWPRVVGTTTDPGHYKLLAALEAFFTRMGIPPQARNLPEVRGRVAAIFALVDPADAMGPQRLMLSVVGVEHEALVELRTMLGEQPGGREFLVNLRTRLCEVLGFAEHPAPPWAQPGAYIFDLMRGPRGVHVKVLSVEKGVATLEGFPVAAETQAVPTGLLCLFRPMDPRMPAGLPCEACGRRQHEGGCGWAPCTRCQPHLYGLIIDGNLLASLHLWWCRLTFDEKGCTCPEHQAKVPFWNATREGWDPKVAAAHLVNAEPAR